MCAVTQPNPTKALIKAQIVSLIDLCGRADIRKGLNELNELFEQYDAGKCCLHSCGTRQQSTGQK